MALTTFVQNSLPTIEAPTNYPNGVSIGVNNVQFPLQVDVPLSPIYTFKLVPTALSATCVAPVQSFGAGTTGGNLTLQTTVQGTAPNIFSKPITFLGQPGVLLDCERSLKVFFSTATTTTSVITITGYDYRGVAMQYTLTLNVGTQTTNVGLPITLVTSVNFSANPFAGNATPTISVGNDKIIGFPYLLRGTTYNDYTYVISNSWAGSTLVTQTGAGMGPGYNWRANPSYLSINFSTRGYADLGTANPPDGTRVLAITYYVYGSDSELNREIKNKNQSSLKIASITKNTSSSYPTPEFVLPYLVEQDLTVIQINPN